jgi:hypothetical protein
MRTFRKNDNVEELKGVLEACIKANFGRFAAAAAQRVY